MLTILKLHSKYSAYLAKPLVGLAFLWSVFLFSGYVENDVFTLRETVSTELGKAKSKTSPFVSFQKTQAIRYVLTIQSLSFLRFKSTLCNYNKLIETVFLQLQKKEVTYLIWRPNLPNKTFPTVTDLDAPSFLMC